MTIYPETGSGKALGTELGLNIRFAQKMLEKQISAVR